MSEHDPNLAELRNRIDRIHRATPGAVDAPTDLWQRVRSQVKSETGEVPAMKMITMPVNSGLPGSASPIGQPGRVRHYTNLVATIAIVITVALAGWFATMQLNRPGESEFRLALTSSTPISEVAPTADSAVCDVESLTVEEVMMIVENPYLFLESRAGNKASPDADSSQLIEAELRPDRYQYEMAHTMVPPKATFEQAQETFNLYLACLPHATYGQLWAMTDPLWVQKVVLGWFPVYVSESEIRVRVEELIDKPLSAYGDPLRSLYFSDQPFELSANPNREESHVALTYSSGYTSIVALGIQVVGPGGEVILTTDSRGMPSTLRIGASYDRPVIVVGKSSLTGEWYVLPWLGDKSIVT